MINREQRERLDLLIDELIHLMHDIEDNKNSKKLVDQFDEAISILTIMLENTY